ncbi:hypothetical protein PX52LOC_06195 [Limnoglobus roseus]|uniref:Uncharacterized protein n=1 Tax=Limnoglobus roseus TaxID=2598579 RepID=A0A5C1ALS9_9BACT|nr:hypothetical protein PX52LOC_06195 [Limnoglobus roseus]
MLISVANFYFNSTLTASVKHGDWTYTSTGCPLGLVVFISVVLIWVFASMIVAAFRFRATSRLVILDEVRNDEDSGNRCLHYRIILKNDSKNTIDDCVCVIESSHPPIPHLQLVLHRTGTPIHQPSSLSLQPERRQEFDLCRITEGREIVEWCGMSGAAVDSPLGDYVVTVVAYGKDILPTRKAFRVRPHGKALILSPAGN